MTYPTEYRYTKEHEWIVVKDGTATIGITDDAQHELGDVVFVELPKAGAKLAAGKIWLRGIREGRERDFRPGERGRCGGKRDAAGQAGDAQHRPARRRMAGESEADESRRTLFPAGRRGV